jgi:hypothetical protein
VDFVAGAELADALGDAVLAGVGVVDPEEDDVVGEAEAAGDAAAVVPEPLEHPARPAAPDSSTSAMPAAPRRAPMRERTAVTGERLPRGLASIVAPESPVPPRDHRRT